MLKHSSRYAHLKKGREDKKITLNDIQEVNRKRLEDKAFSVLHLKTSKTRKKEIILHGLEKREAQREAANRVAE